ncbi:hypothetical protein ZIOFF_051237 [Zingiber officinale]|uniref:Hexosyltransferase n=1 Tax=Zingiber officinale TaxID=94328 RepID=A0A8J5FK46_ZINOF|nr:hypothetical protein ZIOFF_051237 [Zingiber officinale]
MQIRGSGPRPLPNSRISAVMLAMFASMASFYVAGRLWQDAQSRVYLIKELDRRTGQDNHVEASEEQPKKTKLFLAHAAEAWDAEFYAKINDDVYVNIDALGTMLAAHLDKPRAYIGCMKSGEVFSDKSQKWFEPEWWKFGDGKSYFRHASGEMFVVSRALERCLWYLEP